MTIQPHDPHEALFRALPQPGVLCRLVRDEAGAATDLEIVSASETAAAAVAMTADQMTGLRLNAFSGAELVRPILQLAARVARTGEGRSFQSPTPDGRHFDATISRVGVDLVLILAVDVTSLQPVRERDQALRRQSMELQVARAIAGLGFFRTDLRTGVTTWTAELFAMGGLDVPSDGVATPEVLGRAFNGEAAAERDRLVERAIRTGAPWAQELRIARLDGEERWILVNGTIERGPDGMPLAAIGTAMDITTRKHDELALRASEEALRRRTEELEEARRIAGLGTWRLDGRDDTAAWSPELYRIAHMDPDAPPLRPSEIDAMSDPEVVVERSRMVVESAYSGEPFEQEYELHLPSGHRPWFWIRGVGELDEQGVPIGAVGIAMDITTRKHAELALQASEERFRRVLDNLVEGAEILDRDWHVVYINGGFVHDAAYDPAEDIGRSLLEILPGFETTEIFRRFRRCMEERVPDRFEGSYHEPGRGEEWWEFSVQPVPEGIFVLALNITARHFAETASRERDALLRARTEQLEQAGRMAGLGTWQIDASRTHVSWSPEMFEILGYDPVTYEPDAGSIDRLADPEALAVRTHVIAASLATGVPWEVELEVHRPDGDRRWIHLRGTVEQDTDGVVVTHRGTLQDITERKRTEADLRRFSDALEQRVRERTAELEAANEELRSFSYTVSHDLRSPVRAVAGFARILERDLGSELDADALHKLHNIRTAGEAMGRLIDDLLAYTRLGRAAVRREPVPVAAIARRLATMFAARVEDRGGTIELLEPMATPLGDPTLVEELLINLVDNALNYARPDVPPRVRIGATCVGRQVRLSVADNGVGIPPEMRERVFEVFTRLDGATEHQGTGIGLAIVRKAARSMGSDVTVESTVGEGTAFSVLLPCCGAGCAEPS